MSFIDNIRNQPKEKKIRMIWIWCGVAALILIIIWIATAGIHKDVQKDTTLFDTAGRGVNDLRDNYNKPIK